MCAYVFLLGGKQPAAFWQTTAPVPPCSSSHGINLSKHRAGRASSAFFVADLFQDDGVGVLPSAPLLAVYVCMQERVCACLIQFVCAHARTHVHGLMCGRVGGERAGRLVAGAALNDKPVFMGFFFTSFHLVLHLLLVVCLSCIRLRAGWCCGPARCQSGTKLHGNVPAGGLDDRRRVPIPSVRRQALPPFLLLLLPQALRAVLLLPLRSPRATLGGGCVHVVSIGHMPLGTWRSLGSHVHGCEHHHI